jgi:DNA-binding protein HU-beta
MNKADLVAKMSKDAGITKERANLAIDSLVGSVTGGLKKGGRVTLVGFGTFYTSKRKARTGRNPQTGEAIQIKAKRVARFKAGKELESSVK